MANLLPRRDERTYDQLVEALRRQLPIDEWTDHNASDGGMMLLELLGWIGEIAQYRMDRVPVAHENKFLDFIIDPPEPVTVDVTFTAEFVPPLVTAALPIPAGTLLATDFALGRRVVFETVQPLELRRPGVAPLRATGTVRARAIEEVRGEPLGVSDGRPHQVYELRPPRAALGIGNPDEPAVILTDFVNTGVHQPNPRIDVGGTEWTPEPSLLTERARVVIGSEPGLRYMVDGHRNLIRFGDNVFGAIPPAGAVVTCTRYAVLHGPDALAVGENAVHHLLNLAPPVDVHLTFGNTEAAGGARFHPVSRRTALGLREFRAPYRLITESDFERATLVDFNAFQALAGSLSRIVRVAVLFDRRSPLGDGAVAPGYVTLVLMSGDPTSLEADLRSETLSVSAKQALLAPTTPLVNRLRRFLDPRRLITTRVEFAPAALTGITLAATVAVASDRNLVRAQEELRTRLFDFLSVLRGEDGRGWRIGRGVYRSQLFRLLEDTDGVDHVVSLSLTPADADGNVIIQPHELPVVQGIALTVVRA